jgi:hypothetical protein
MCNVGKKVKILNGCRTGEFGHIAKEYRTGRFGITEKVYMIRVSSNMEGLYRADEIQIID